MSAAAWSMVAWSDFSSPVVPISMAMPRSRQVLSQCRIEPGEVKSIRTFGVERKSEVIGTPIVPTAATAVRIPLPCVAPIKVDDGFRQRIGHPRALAALEGCASSQWEHPAVRVVPEPHSGGGNERA